MICFVIYHDRKSLICFLFSDLSIFANCDNVVYYTSSKFAHCIAIDLGGKQFDLSPLAITRVIDRDLPKGV